VPHPEDALYSFNSGRLTTDQERRLAVREMALYFHVNPTRRDNSKDSLMSDP